MKIRAAKAYVLGVKKTRVFFLGVLSVLVCLVLLANGLQLIHTALFTYSEWSIQDKFTAVFLLGFMECWGAAGILYYLFREKTWVMFAGIHEVINTVVEKKGN